jgi:hypothetical protein
VADDTAEKDTYELFMGAMDVSNRALETVRDKPVLSDLLELMEKQASGRQFGVAVYKDDPTTPHDYFTVRVQNHRIQLVSHGKDAPDIDWKVSEEYLRDVTDNPDSYVENPLKLDLDWLRHRLSDAA